MGQTGAALGHRSQDGRTAISTALAAVYSKGPSEPRTQRSGVSGGRPLTPLRCVRGSDGPLKVAFPSEQGSDNALATV
jgi:hypothetical protein